MDLWLNMPFYSLVVSVSLAILWGVWRITGMRRLTHWRVNRAVLMLIPVISLMIGLIPFLSSGDEGLSAAVAINPVVSPTFEGADFSPLDAAVKAQPLYMEILPYVIIVYWIGVTASLIFMLAGLCQVLNIIRKSRVSTDNPHLRVSDRRDIMSFAWGRWVVMPESDYRENGSVVLTHELAHLRYRHWLDLILINIVKAVTWYCPVSYAIAHDMTENHEFEADNSVVKAGYDASGYQLYLVEKAAHRRFANSVVCGINNPYSLIKTRILMMQKKESRRSTKLRALGFVPVAVMLALAATSPILAACVQKDTKDTEVVINSVTVTVIAIVLTDEELMEPRPEEITLPVANREVLNKWASSLRYPEDLARDGKQGRVLVKARVSTKGEITDVSVFKSSGYKGFDDEALRVIKGTTGLTPAMYNGNKADIDCLIPIRFKKQTGPDLPEIDGKSGFMLDEIVAMIY